MGPLALIYNPGSGRHRDRQRAVSKMVDAPRRRGIGVKAHGTEAPGDATRLSREALAAGAPAIVVLFDRRGRLDFLRHLSAGFSGTQLGRPGVTYLQARRATASDGKTWVQGDGELLGHLSMTFECVPAALSLIVP